LDSGIHEAITMTGGTNKHITTRLTPIPGRGVHGEQGLSHSDARPATLSQTYNGSPRVVTATTIPPLTSASPTTSSTAPTSQAAMRSWQPSTTTGTKARQRHADGSKAARHHVVKSGRYCVRHGAQHEQLNAMQTPERLRIRRSDGVECRYWPEPEGGFRAVDTANYNRRARLSDQRPEGDHYLVESCRHHVSDRS
jgi:hypothetical protein